MKVRFSQSFNFFSIVVSVLCSTIILSCNNTNKQDDTDKFNNLSEEQKHLPENALKGLTISEGLEVKSFAYEPMLKNPTNIDVDERGRVWVTEAYNYRPGINGNPTNPEGDRIVILEDNNGDGIADTSKVFYQGPEMNAPLGICVLGNKVIVCQSPNIWVFTDENGDDKADKKEVMFSGIGGEQHDHGAHAFTFGADGKLYFNLGNEGKTLKDKNGKDVLDQDGDVIGPKKYKQGMVFRCDVDGSHVECMGNNFRNPFEVAVDSYGTLWQSDNDDDGNQGTRINYVMPYGNYGYTDEITGASWQSNRTNIEDSTPFKHWHLNDPGEIPNLLQTGAGSPTGIVVYEGKLLPKEFQGQMIHCDAGPNVVRAYPIKKNGAGYSAEIINILKGENDKWFRPSDVCVAPDGSLIIADWYDPGVGGHAAGDQSRGRIYRIAPKGSNYTIAKEDYSTTSGALHALQNPNLSVRYHAYNTLQQFGSSAIPTLEKSWRSDEDSRMQARAFWVLVKMKNADQKKYINEAIKSKDTDLKILGIRASKQLNTDLIPIIKSLVNDEDKQVRRECAIALRHNTSKEAADLWAILAAQHDGKDRWYLEALGIGADRQWDSFFSAYLKVVKDPLATEGSRDLVWRARTDIALPYLATLASNSKETLNNRLRYFRSFDFNNTALKSQFLLKMIKENVGNDTLLNKYILRTLDKKIVPQSKDAQEALKDVLYASKQTEEFIELISRFEVKTENKALLELAIDKSGKSLGENAAEILIKMNGVNLIWNTFNEKDTSRQNKLISSLAHVGNKESVDILQTIILSNKYPNELKSYAAKKIGKTETGELRVLSLLKNKKAPTDLIPDIVYSVKDAWRAAIRIEAESYLSKTDTKKSITKEPIKDDLLALKADSKNGNVMFMNNCASCHKIGNVGVDFGPQLSAIGSKLPKEAILESIVHPSAGIGFGYEGWQIKMVDGSSVTGIIASKTGTEVEMKFPGGSRTKINKYDIASMTEMKSSMMTEGLHQNMTNQELADLLEYLSGLKK